jgi:hypothetical protein
LFSFSKASSFKDSALKQQQQQQQQQQQTVFCCTEISHFDSIFRFT